jgi:hypothetical protein
MEWEKRIKEAKKYGNHVIVKDVNFFTGRFKCYVGDLWTWMPIPKMVLREYKLKLLLSV